MAEVAYLEIINRLGRVRYRAKLEGPNVTIGRSYTNDVILDDPFVSPLHISLELTPEKTWKVRDLKSENGLFLLSPSRRISEAELKAEDVIRVGRTLLRLRGSDFPIAPTKLDRDPGSRWLRFVYQSWSAPVLFLALYAVLAINVYLGEYEDLAANKLVLHAVSTFCILLVAVLSWSGIWGLITRILQRRFYFLSHAAAVCMGALLIFIYTNSCNYLAFSLSLGNKFSIFNGVGLSVLCALVLFVHLRICSEASSRKLLAIACSTVAILSGVIGVTVYSSEQEFSNNLRFKATVKPPIFRLAGTKSADEFLNQITRLKASVDKAANKK